LDETTIQFYKCFLTCRLKNTDANYKASTRTLIQKKDKTNAQKQNKEYKENKTSTTHVNNNNKTKQVLLHNSRILEIVISCPKNVTN